MRATDASGAWVNKTIYLVASANSAPTGIAPASSSYVIGRTFAWAQPLGAVFGDIDANIASVSATLADGSALPGWMSLETVYRADGPYLVLAGQSPDTVANNTIYSVKFTAVDALGLSGSTQMNVLFKVNSGPTATASIPDQRIFNNTLFQSTISLASLFSDVDGDALDYSMVLPQGSPLAGWLSYVVDREAGMPVSTSAGLHAIELRAIDASGGSTGISFNFRMNSAPLYTGGADNRTVILGHNFSFSLPSTVFTDPDGDSVSLSAMQQVTVAGHYDGEGIWEPEHDELQALPAWLTFNAVTRTFSGIAPSTAASVRINLQAIESYGLGNDVEFTLSAAASANSAPVYSAGSLANQSAIEGQVVSYSLPVNAFTDANADALSYSAQVYVGTSWVAASTIGLSINAGTGLLSGTLSGITQASYNVKITASDGIATAFGTFTLSVNRKPVITAIPDQTLTPGQAFSYNAASRFSDPDGDSITYTATGLPAGVTLSTAGLFSGTPSAGAYTITVQATDSRGAVSSDVFVLTVGSAGNLPPTVNQTYLNGLSTSAYAGEYISINVSAAFSDANGDTLTYSQSGKPSWLNFNTVTGVFSGTALNVENSWNITVTANDGHGGTVSGTVYVEALGNGGGGGQQPLMQQFMLAGDGEMSAMTYYPEETDPIGVGGGAYGNGTSTLNQDVWYAYDANNRVLVANGALVGGQILLSNNAISAAYSYDAAGNQVARRLVLNGSELIERRTYDLRGQQIYVFQPVAPGATPTTVLAQKSRYDVVGRLVEQIDYYGAGSTRAKSGGGTQDISGWIKHAETMSYDQDGRLSKSSSFGRVKDWVAASSATGQGDLVKLTNLTVTTQYYDGLSRS